MNPERQRPPGDEPAGEAQDQLAGVIDLHGIAPRSTDPDAPSIACVFDVFHDAQVVTWDRSDLAAAAITYGANGWPVFPLAVRSKVPATRHGVLDATDDIDQLVRWWAHRPRANIGGRVPPGVVVVDIDPRSGGDRTWADLINGRPTPTTRTTLSGRGDGGRHLWWRHPGGPVVASLGPGVDVKTNSGYMVMPPSIHPDTGDPYRWEDPATPIVAPPAWLASALRRKPTPAKQPTARPAGDHQGDSIADWFTAAHTWADVLVPHGWRLVAGDGDSDGSRWQHPTATTAASANIRHGQLFVFSPNTPLPVTETNAPAGLTRFRAWALLDHNGDLRTAARTARQRHPNRKAKT